MCAFLFVQIALLQNHFKEIYSAIVNLENLMTLLGSVWKVGKPTGLTSNNGNTHVYLLILILELFRQVIKLGSQGPQKLSSLKSLKI